MTLIDNKVSTLGKSATLAINEKVRALRSEGKKIFSFGLGQSPFPVPESVVMELQNRAYEKDYLPVQGLSKLCTAVADFHRREDKVSFSEQNIMIGPGSKELMFTLQLALDIEINIPAPCWVSYYPQAIITGRKVNYIHTTAENNWKLTPEQLSSHYEGSSNKSQQLLILNYPSNPCGTTYSANELEEIANVARNHNIVILSDEIYGKTKYKGNHVSIARFYPEGTIISSGLSKWCGAGGWRLGTFAFPTELEWVKNAMTVVASETYTSVSAPIQHAAVVAFNGNKEIENYLESSRAILNALGTWIVAMLHANNVKVATPEGGFYILPDFSFYKERLKGRGIDSSSKFSDRLLKETGVATLPGSNFGIDDTALILRMSFVDFDGKKAIEAANAEIVNQLFLEEYCKNVLEGIRNLVSWLE